MKEDDNLLLLEYLFTHSSHVHYILILTKCRPVIGNGTSRNCPRKSLVGVFSGHALKNFAKSTIQLTVLICMMNAPSCSMCVPIPNSEHDRVVGCVCKICVLCKIRFCKQLSACLGLWRVSHSAFALATASTSTGLVRTKKYRQS